MKGHRRTLALVLPMLLGSSVPGGAQSPPPSDPAQGQPPATQEPEDRRTFRLFPAGDVYQIYVADPHRPTNAIMFGFYGGTSIPEAGPQRTFLAAGGRFGLLRIDSTRPRGRAWQVSIDAGLDALFDSQYKNDGLGWDGNYGFTLTTASAGSPFSLKAAVLHVSAHLGDEYEARTSRERINYTREEVAVGFAWQLRPAWRTYAETGMAYRMRSDGQERWRWQAGLEFEARPTVADGRMAWYAAADVASLGERGWRVDTAIQGGLVMRANSRAYRLFAGWTAGRPPLGQFTSYSESSVSLGLKIDL